MNSIFKILLLIILTATTSYAATQNKIGLSDEEKAFLKKHPVIRVSNEMDWRPFDFVKNGKPQGYSVEYLELIAKTVGFEIEWVNGATWSELVEMAKNKELDLMQSIAKNEEREKFLNFTKPYTKNPRGIFTKADNIKITKLKDLTTEKIAVVKDFWTQKYLAENYPYLKLIPVSSTLDGLLAVTAGSADVYIGNIPSGKYAMQQNFLTSVKLACSTGVHAMDSNSGLCFASRKDYPELVSILEKGMDAIPLIEYTKFTNKWSKVVEPSNLLTSKELQWLQKHSEIRLGVASSWKPFEFLDDDNKYSGISSDIVRKLNAKLSINFNPVKGLTWDESLQAAKNGKIDAFSCIMETEKRKEFLLFTEPYFISPIVIFANNNSSGSIKWEDLRNKKVAVPKGFATQEFLEKDFPGIKLMLFDTVPEVLQAVSKGDADATIGSLQVIEYTYKQEGIKNIRVAGVNTPYNWKLAFGVRKDWHELIPILNKSLATITEKEKSLLVDNWVNMRVVKRVEHSTDWDSVFKIGGAISLIAIIIIAIILSANKKLTHEIKMREEIQKALELSRNEAEKSANVKSEFLANMSHEIRTPMNAINGMAYLCLQTELNPQQEDYIIKIQNAGTSLINIINDILDFSKMEAGKLDINNTSFALDKVLDNQLVLLKYSAMEKNLNLIIDIDENIPNRLIGDNLRLGQVLANLSSNATKFTEKGKITISVKLKEKLDTSVVLLFSIKDTGIGMTEKDTVKLFKPFEQANSSTTKRFGGTGLGLSISKRLVEMMGGEIWVESKIGSGSTFSFSLEFRICTARLSESTAALAKIDNSNLLGAKILIVEDNLINQQIASELLRKVGSITSIASNGADAVDMIKKGDFDLILMDIQMPIMDGCKATKIIRNDLGFADLPIVAMTANALKSDLDEYLAIGMNAVETKPIEVHSFFKTLCNLVRAKHNFIEEVIKKEETKKDIAKQREEDILLNLPHLNVVDGLTRVADDKELYKTVLLMFRDNYANSIIELKETLENEGAEAASRKAHALKGVSGNISAEELFKFSDKITEALRAEDTAKVDELMPHLEQAFNNVMTSLKTL